jgi:hypothetical protein
MSVLREFPRNTGSRHLLHFLPKLYRSGVSEQGLYLRKMLDANRHAIPEDI